MRIFFNVRFVLCLMLGFCGALGLASCSRQAKDSLPRLRVQYGTEPVSLDPALAEDGVALRILGNTSEGLMGYDEEGRLVPRLAQNVQISEDGKTYSFTLRANAKWSDGKPVTAKDFVIAFRRVLAPSSRSKLGMMLAPIRGSALYRDGKIKEDQLGVRDENGRLVIELESPAPYFIQALSLPSALPVRSDILATYEGEWPEKGPSTGPYFIEEHVPDRKIILKKNSFYYGFEPEVSSVPDVELKFVADETTALNLFEKGKLDLITKINAMDLKRMREMGILRTDPFYAVYYLAFQVRRPPFDSRDWRRAVSGAIQREQILAALDTGDKPAASWIPHGIEGFIPYEPQAFVKRFQDSISRIQKLPKAALPLDPVPAGFDNTHRNALIMEKVQEDVLRVLRLRLLLQRLDWKSYVRTLQVDAPPVFRFGWQAPFMDPLPLLLVFTSNDPNNYTRWKNKQYDQLVKEIAEMKPSAEREKKIWQAQEILVYKEAVVVPLYHYVQHHAVSPRISNFKVNPLGVIRFDKLRLSGATERK